MTRDGRRTNNYDSSLEGDGSPIITEIGHSGIEVVELERMGTSKASGGANLDNQTTRGTGRTKRGFSVAVHSAPILATGIDFHKPIGTSGKRWQFD